VRAKERQELGINQYSFMANLPPAGTGKTRYELSEISGVLTRNKTFPGVGDSFRNVVSCQFPTWSIINTKHLEFYSLSALFIWLRGLALTLPLEIILPFARAKWLRECTTILTCCFPQSAFQSEILPY